MSVGHYFSEHRLGLERDVPESDRRMAQEVADDYDRRRRVEADDRHQQLSEVVESANRRVRDLLGEDKWLSLRRHMRDERVRFRDMFQPPAARYAEYDTLNAERRANIQSYFETLGADRETLRAVVTETSAAVQRLLPGAVMEGGYADWLPDAPVRPAPPPIQDDPHAWTAFRPPYPGFQMGFGPTNLGGFRISREHALDAAGGLVGHDLMLDNNDASDFDNGWAVVDTQIGFNYRAPATGVVEILIEARSTRGHHHLRVVDEWGVSDSSTSHENSLMAHVLHPNVTAPSFAWMSRFRWNTDSTAVVDRDFLVSGGMYTARLFSNGPVLQGQTVHIRAGTRSTDGSITNDMEINSRSSFRWFFGAVWVRIAP